MCKDKMQTEVSDSEKSYSKEVYNACKYMIEHLEEFKDFKIYGLINVDLESHSKVDVC